MTPVTTPTNNRIPSDNWTLDRLGQYIAATARKTAEQAWYMGTALNIAFGKCERGQWKAFCGQHFPFLSATTVWRLRRVAELPFDEVQGTALKAVYKRLSNGVPPAEEQAGLTDPTSEANDRKDGPDLEAEVARIVDEAPDYLTALEGAVVELADDLGFIAPDRAALVRALVELLTRTA